ncbi:MAG: hypothetical protein ACR2RE_14080 [Geminicoccaceae bacterium]
MTPHAANKPEDIKCNVNPTISLPVFEAISSAYAIARTDPVISKIVISFFFSIDSYSPWACLARPKSSSISKMAATVMPIRILTFRHGATWSEFGTMLIAPMHILICFPFTQLDLP